jgi:septation ring formation regulator EzrA
MLSDRSSFQESESLENTVEDLQKARGRLEDMEGQLTELNERLEDEEDNNAEVSAVKHKLEDEIEDLKQEVTELGTALDKVKCRLSFVHHTCVQYNNWFT